MKTPHGFVYAILITVAIVAVTLFARSQVSPMVAPANVQRLPPESATDNAGADVKEGSGREETNKKPYDEVSK